MQDRRFIRTFIFLAACFIFPLGCIEHTYKITALPSDRAKLEYQAKGDTLDLHDGKELLPDSTEWNIRRSVEEKDNETIHIIDAENTAETLKEISSKFNWQDSPEDTIYLQRDFNISKQWLIFGDKYTFRGMFKSRRFKEKYGDIWDYVPEECRVLENDATLSSVPAEEIKVLERKFATGVLQWNLVRYEKRFKKVWEILKRKQGHAIDDTSLTAFSIASTAWSEDLRQYLNQMDIPNPNTVDLEWWGDIKSVFMGGLVDLAGVEHAILIREVSESLESEYQISKDIEDDKFVVKVLMPGKPAGSNGRKDDAGFQTWEMPGEELLNKDFIMEASSFEFSYWRIALFGVVLVFGIRMIKRILTRK